MDVLNLLKKYSLTDFPAAIGGCQNQQTSYDCCEYNVSVFDERTEPDTVVEFDGKLVSIHHCSLSEIKSNVLAQFAGMRIVHDEKWELRMLLSRIDAKKNRIYKDYMRNSLIDSLFCITRSREGLKTSDPFSPCWIKCAAFYLADAILLHHLVRPSPAHFLQSMRELKDDRISEKFSIVNECIGMERSTPVLLDRMLRSTVGFSDMIEGNDHSKIIQAKSDYFLQNSLLSDCYFYLGYVNRNNIIKIKNDIPKRPELIHVLKVAFDIESDPLVIEKQAGMLYEAVSYVLSSARS